jgi:hypothetical protein
MRWSKEAIGNLQPYYDFDELIATIAMTNSAAVVTRDEHFRNYPPEEGLRGPARPDGHRAEAGSNDFAYPGQMELYLRWLDCTSVGRERADHRPDTMGRE